MKFIFADAQDTIDLDYNFLTDEFSPKRVIQRTDKYPHEVFSKKPYDGMLISRGLLDDGIFKSSSCAYTSAQTRRIKMQGIKRFLRYYDGEIFGDNGAFSYHMLDEPPYSVSETVAFYEKCKFNYGMSVDHIIFEYDKRFDTDGDFDDNYKVTEKMQKRYDITINNAKEFLKECAKQKVHFHPIGVIQAWSPNSMKRAASELIDMGYTYIAIGGLVPLDINSCEEIVKSVRDEIGYDIKIHLLGFAKAKQLDRFIKYKITSFDSTSPLIRAFKDEKDNYYTPKDHYTAIRIPSSQKTPALKRKVSSGLVDQEEAEKLEEKALSSIRAYDKGKETLENTLKALEEYELIFRDRVPIQRYKDILSSKYWQKCQCEVCQNAKIETIIFRNSNRNRRRGFHNLWQFQRELEELREANNIC
ncbi:tRNA-guanine transglycosylase DpdA [Aliarcobacter cryaerophilus]|uniref:tRNA-guanine transglycosylase DpdA n=1 Tax=Aliarcobacter cryaerophilus TaxID=28198 RepID=UPI003DA59DE6